MVLGLYTASPVLNCFKVAISIRLYPGRIRRSKVQRIREKREMHALVVVSDAIKKPFFQAFSFLN